MSQKEHWGLVPGHRDPSTCYGARVSGLPRIDVHLRLTIGITEVIHLPLRYFRKRSSTHLGLKETWADTVAKSLTMKKQSEASVLHKNNCTFSKRELTKLKGGEKPGNSVHSRV